MGKKIHSVILKDSKIVELEGEFHQIFENENRYPLFITNHSLRRGRDLGLIESSLISDLVKLEPSIKSKNKDAASRSVIEELSEEKMLNVIYLAFLGANPKTELSIDQFVERYHGDYLETTSLYTEIISSVLPSQDSKFAKGLNESTKKTSSNEKK
ncbi:hypothetical protein FZW96_12065 [Bacillus sp. BGMRC 2118]|nr:hypothetical protein FZW96_12065 [Bacillus sp. BGMRC 2118]